MYDAKFPSIHRQFYHYIKTRAYREESVDPLLGHERCLEDEPHREDDDAVFGIVEKVLQVLKQISSS